MIFSSVLPHNVISSAQPSSSRACVRAPDAGVHVCACLRKTRAEQLIQQQSAAAERGEIAVLIRGEGEAVQTGHVGEIVAQHGGTFLQRAHHHGGYAKRKIAFGGRLVHAAQPHRHAGAAAARIQRDHAAADDAAVAQKHTAAQQGTHACAGCGGCAGKARFFGAPVCGVGCLLHQALSCAGGERAGQRDTPADALRAAHHRMEGG